MAREMLHRAMMQTTQDTPDYVGALIEEERRLVLVSVNPEEPWEAFRRLRRALRKESRRDQAVVDIFHAPHALEHNADVISLAARRRAG